MHAYTIYFVCVKHQQHMLFWFTMELMVHVVQQYHYQKEDVCCIEGCPNINFIVTAFTRTGLVSMIIWYAVLLQITMELMVHVVQQYHPLKGHAFYMEGCPNIKNVVTNPHTHISGICDNSFV